MRRPLLAVSLLLAAAPAAAQFTARDSAGVRIVESQRPVWTDATAWRLAAKPLQIGAVDGEEPYMFATVMGLVRLSDGTIVAGDMVSSQLRFFDRAGKHVRTVGRKGEGPGEFSQVMSILKVRADTLVVEAGTDRYAWFAPDGTFLSEARLWERIPEIGFVRPRFFFADGRILMTSSPQPARGRSGRWIDSTSLFLRAGPAADAARQKIATLPLIEFAGGSPSASPVTFGARPVLVVGPDRLYWDYSTSMQVHVLDLAGRRLQTWRRPWPRTPVTKAILDHYHEQFVNAPDENGGTSAEWKQFREKRFAEMVFADELPAHQQAGLDAAGHVWLMHTDPLLEYDAPGYGDFGAVPKTPTRWSVFAPTGRWLGEVELPARFLVREIGADYVLGIWKDADGVEYIRQYGLVKPR